MSGRPPLGFRDELAPRVKMNSRKATLNFLTMTSNNKLIFTATQYTYMQRKPVLTLIIGNEF